MATFNTPSEQQKPWTDEGTQPTRGIVDSTWYNFYKNICNWIVENSQSGTTAQRPTTNLYSGRTYTDTTISIQITYINGAWRNGAGVSV